MFLLVSDFYFSIMSTLSILTPSISRISKVLLLPFPILSSSSLIFEKEYFFQKISNTFKVVKIVLIWEEFRGLRVREVHIVCIL